MYDYIKVLSSDQKTLITFAYSVPQNGARQEEYICEKQYNRFCKISTLVTGEVKKGIIPEQDFYFMLGMAVGELSKDIPKT